MNNRILRTIVKTLIMSWSVYFVGQLLWDGNWVVKASIVVWLVLFYLEEKQADKEWLRKSSKAGETLASDIYEFISDHNLNVKDEKETLERIEKQLDNYFEKVVEK